MRAFYWRIDGQWIKPAMLAAGRAEEMEYMLGVYVVVNKAECRQRPLRPHTLKWVDKVEGDGCLRNRACQDKTLSSVQKSVQCHASVGGTECADQFCCDRWEHFLGKLGDGVARVPCAPVRQEPTMGSRRCPMVTSSQERSPGRNAACGDTHCEECASGSGFAAAVGRVLPIAHEALRGAVDGLLFR